MKTCATSTHGSKWFLLFLLVIILFMALLTGCTLFDPKPADNQDPDEDTPDDPVAKVSYEWVVEPTFDYLEVINFYGRLCARLEEPGPWGSFYCFLDTQTGELLNDGLPPMGGGGNEIAYDKNKAIWSRLEEYGYLSSFAGLAELLEACGPNFINTGGHFIVREISLPASFLVGDTAHLLEPEHSHIYESLGKFALADKNGLITEFLFDNYDTYLWSSRTPPIAVKLGNKWGFIDKTGNTVIPFEFDDVAGIDDDKSFVRKDGKWGILKRIP